MESEVTRLVEYDGQQWVVRAPASGRASYRGASRPNAVARAKQIVRNLGGGLVEIHARDGSLEQSASVHPRPGGRRRARSG